MKGLLIGMLLAVMVLPSYALDWHFAKPEYDYWFTVDRFSLPSSFCVSAVWYYDEVIRHSDRNMNKAKAHLMSIGGTIGFELVKEIVDGFHYHEAGCDGFSYKDLIYSTAGAVSGSYAVDFLAQKNFIGPYQGFQVMPWSQEKWDMTHFEEGFLSAGAVIMVYNALEGGRIFGEIPKENSKLIATFGVLGAGITLELLNGMNMFPAGNKWSTKDVLGKVAGVTAGFLVIQFVDAPWAK